MRAQARRPGAAGEIEALLSQGLPNSPMAGARIRVASGNFITARPIGVVDGIDFQFTGASAQGRRRRRSRGASTPARWCCAPNIGYSPTGEVFNLRVGGRGRKRRGTRSRPTSCSSSPTGCRRPQGRGAGRARRRARPGAAEKARSGRVDHARARACPASRLPGVRARAPDHAPRPRAPCCSSCSRTTASAR